MCVKLIEVHMFLKMYVEAIRAHMSGMCAKAVKLLGLRKMRKSDVC